MSECSTESKAFRRSTKTVYNSLFSIVAFLIVSWMTKVACAVDNPDLKPY